MSNKYLGLGMVAVLALFASHAGAQEQIDQADRQKQAAAVIANLSLRVRVTQCVPPAKELVVAWRRGGEGLGGTVVRGPFTPAMSDVPDIDSKLKTPTVSPYIAFNQWTAWIPVETVCGRGGGWEFPSVTVTYPPTGKKTLDPPEQIAVEFEFAERGKKFTSFVERAPKGATVGFAFPGRLLDQRGAANAEFRRALQGLAGHARARREHLEKLFPEPFAPPQQFGLLGHLGGYGEGPGSGLRKALGFGVRHCNPEIVADECRTLRLLGVNGMVDGSSLHLADAAKLGDQFRHTFWGGPGSGSPMAAVSSNTMGEPDGCPFDPRLKTTMAERVAHALSEHEASGAKERWGLWWDEIGVAVKGHMNDCPQCRAAFCDYLRKNHVTPADVGAASWDAVAPYKLWTVTKTPTKTSQSGNTPPADPAGRLLYYYTFRFMTHATANLFPESAARMKEAGVWLYAMQGPTPSWNGSSLDWHEFYDHKANTAIVWETSNRDPRSWQWESYLADIVRGISLRHDLPIGCLVKPHRGAPQQRMLSVVSRGTRAIEWYTYGPDYSKGDSFSQSPQLLEEVAIAGRFLAKGEKWLAGAKFAVPAEVALVSPRSSEIWGKATELGVAPFENAKCLYLALRHEHIPVDILSEQQLAEGVPTQYKVLYIPGPHLRRDATAKVADFVRAGGTLWTDAMGLSRDEANEPNAAAAELLGLSNRKYESWSRCPDYRATTLEPFAEKDAPESAALSWKSPDSDATSERQARAVVGRESLVPRAGFETSGQIMARFSDKVPAVIMHRVGQGKVYVAGFWSGLTYTATVRRSDFNMQTDYDAALRSLIAQPALEQNIVRPAVPANPLVEAVALKNGAGSSIALTNWSYARGGDPNAPRGAGHQVLENLVVQLPATATKVRSLIHGELPLQSIAGQPSITLPKMGTIDLLILD